MEKPGVLVLTAVLWFLLLHSHGCNFSKPFSTLALFTRFANSTRQTILHFFSLQTFANISTNSPVMLLFLFPSTKTKPHRQRLSETVLARIAHECLIKKKLRKKIDLEQELFAAGRPPVWHTCPARAGEIPASNKAGANRYFC